MSSTPAFRRRLGEISETANLATAAHDGVEDQPGEDVEESEDHQSSGEDRGGQARHQMRVHVRHCQRRRQDHRGEREQDTDRAEEQHRPFDPVETDDRAQDAKAVTIGGELRFRTLDPRERSEEHTSELQSLMRTSYAVFCLKKKTTKTY